VLDGVVGDAAPRVDVARLGNCVRRTGGNAGAAVAAAVGVRRVGLELEVGDERAQE